MLIGINGPIASGKSAVARAVARELDRRGTTAAVIDIDLVYDMLDHAVGVPKGDDRSWRAARRAAAAITDTFLSDGIDAVIVEGRLFVAERREYLEALESPIYPRFVTLHVSYEEALRRAQNDETRGVSRDPAFLGPYFLGVERDLAEVPRTDLRINTERLDITESVAQIVRFADDSR